MKHMFATIRLSKPHGPGKMILFVMPLLGGRKRHVAVGVHGKSPVLVELQLEINLLHRGMLC